MGGLSMNDAAWSRLDAMAARAESLRIQVSAGSCGERLLDAGAGCPGGIEAGLELARLCLGGQGTVRLATDPSLPNWPSTLVVASSQPVRACLGSQYAGWSLSAEPPDRFFALASGPGRALARKEALFAELDVAERAEHAVLVLEAAKPPPASVVDTVARDCGVPPERLAFAYAPTQSLAGSVQVVARVLEVALHKAHALHFPLDRILDGLAAAPVSPPHPDFVTAMGRTNDAIIFGGRAHLFVSGPAADARALAEALPASTSRDYGRPFAEVFKAAGSDFYKIDAMLFSPAQALVTAVDTGETFRAGQLDPALLDRSFGA